jgi:GntR family transcriptional repressor for pyruvate dehydrogenase complex
MVDETSLRAVKRTRVSEDIAGQLSDLITRGQLKAGDQLPSERELSERFQVSRASVREAIRALESTGLVASRQGEGTYVVAGPESLLRPFASEASQAPNGWAGLFEARKLVEPQVAALAAERATDAELVAMTAILDGQAEEVRAGGTGMEADTAFHLALARAAKNPFLVRLVSTLVDSLKESRGRSVRREGRAARSLAGHRLILEAVRERNKAKARATMLRHLEGIEGVDLETASMS